MAELYAVRGNKHLKITEADRATHLALGYDIAEVDGNRLEVVEVAPDKTVPYAKYRAALDRIAVLEKGNNKELEESLKGAITSNEALNKALGEARSENKALKAELAKTKKEGGK